MTRNRSASHVITLSVSQRVRHSPRPTDPAVLQRTLADSGSPSTIEYVVRFESSTSSPFGRRVRPPTSQSYTSSMRPVARSW